MSSLGVLEVVVIVLVVLVVVAFVLSRTMRTTPTTGVARPATSVRLDAETIRSISDLIAQDKKIQAIKVLRTATGLTLKESKDWVESWDPAAAAAGPPDARASAPPATSGTDLSGTDLSGAGLDDLAIEARAIARTSGAITAIKHVREQTGWGLAEAKAYVDALGVD
ncbi:ribosomal protein L7/L12 [Aeromicrobium stalagmiti]|uniref:ribosomal protein L7/L12 n=1 Tax=Aeromicrobium stalagmiti TaxID=2738988 RepID=UPI00156A31EC|nr:ribosomal protein L7/L12 [Aeromicrobium stalagmiti]NRQ50778.1 ribosomal protein L7/L12 [Aeromicrobium stalagmiti]